MYIIERADCKMNFADWVLNRYKAKTYVPEADVYDDGIKEHRMTALAEDLCKTIRDSSRPRYLKERNEYFAAIAEAWQDYTAEALEEGHTCDA